MEEKKLEGEREFISLENEVDKKKQCVSKGQPEISEVAA